ncbi:MAG TPA: Stp1/IreP family PP2C-type Ser/Thr phosphatase [Patescibacteria group bacterium]|nr:Stp1/IreP family PP2C-type Ser/Thr phosphatase [Patescibacteria group bacterium]
MEEINERKPFTIVAVSDRGSVRPRNEDYFGIFDPETDELAETCGVLVIVADGMGGHLSGAEASRTVVDALAETYFHDCKEDEKAIDRLARAFREANRTVFLKVGEGRKGLAGTTCTALALFPDSVHLVHAGDSRAYLIREGKITQLTKDHSVVGEMVRNGMLSKEEARHHPRRNVITKAVGLREEVDPDSHAAIPLKSHDILVACSDGLFSMLGDDAIAAIVTASTPEKACKELVREANAKGGEDNITVVIAQRM